MNTTKQDRQIAVAIDDVQIAVRDLTADQVVLVLYAMLELRGDITPDRMTALANDLGLAAWMKARNVPPAPVMLADMRALEGAL